MEAVEGKGRWVRFVTMTALFRKVYIISTCPSSMRQKLLARGGAGKPAAVWGYVPIMLYNQHIGGGSFQSGREFSRPRAEVLSPPPNHSANKPSKLC